MTPPTLPVTVILVTYNSEDVIGTALGSIDAGAEIIVVDNASDDATLDIVRAAGNVIVRSNDSNVGFGTACNIGARSASQPFLLFLNPDAQLQPGALQHLLAAAEAHPEAAAYNPRILDAEGNPSWRRRSRLLSPALNAKLKVRPQASCDLEMITGAALFCRAAAFWEIGGFDENIFLYCEDDDLAVRFRQHGYRLRHVHEAVVMHSGDASSPPSPEVTRFKSYHHMKSIIYALEKHGMAARPRLRRILHTCNLMWASLTANEAKRAKYRGYLEALRPSQATKKARRTTRPDALST